jgi:hypothetical protein
VQNTQWGREGGCSLLVLFSPGGVLDSWATGTPEVMLPFPQHLRRVSVPLIATFPTSSHISDCQSSRRIKWLNAHISFGTVSSAFQRQHCGLQNSVHTDVKCLLPRDGITYSVVLEGTTSSKSEYDSFPDPTLGRKSLFKDGHIVIVVNLHDLTHNMLCFLWWFFKFSQEKNPTYQKR